MHSLVKGAPRPYFQIREFGNEQLVRCFYHSRLYREVHRALEHENAVVHATGEMQLDRARRAINQMTVERLDRVEPLTDEEFRSLFGSAHDLTGEMTTAEFVENIRADG
jgi:uncharacterized damage-inducible protein DinB